MSQYASSKKTRAFRQRLLEKFNYKCPNCGRTENLTIDHIIPRSKNGKTTFENLQLLCDVCNRKKGSSNIICGWPPSLGEIEWK